MRPASEMPALAPPAPTEHIDEHAVAPQQEPAPPHVPEPEVSQPEPLAAPSQADLLARAWQALARHDPQTTLSLLDDDQRRHPHGALAEERDAMRVQALAAVGKRDEARARADAFFARYPQSVHRAAVEKAVAP
jgi:hypothetical protein